MKGCRGSSNLLPSHRVASHMESTGIKSRIQASQATATLRVQGGMGHWVKPRDELVMAKGKGTKQTYWIEVKKATSAANVDHNSDKPYSHSNEGITTTSVIIELPEFDVSNFRTPPPQDLDSIALFLPRWHPSFVTML
jgi:hypothetical protein